MSISVGEILKVVAVIQWLDGDIMQNVFSTVVSGSGGPFDEADIVDDMLEWVEEMYANIVTGVTDDVDGSEVRVYVYDPVDDDYDEIGSVAWVWNPSDTGEYLPRGVAGLINCKTTDPDVSGKKYIGGITEVGAVDGLIGNGMITLLSNFAVDWVTGFTGSTSSADFTPGVWSPTRTNFYAMSGSVIIPTIPAYQRRRKQGIGI